MLVGYETWKISRVNDDAERDRQQYLEKVASAAMVQFIRKQFGNEGDCIPRQVLIENHCNVPFDLWWPKCVSKEPNNKNETYYINGLDKYNGILVDAAPLAAVVQWRGKCLQVLN